MEFKLVGTVPAIQPRPRKLTPLTALDRLLDDPEGAARALRRFVAALLRLTPDELPPGQAVSGKLRIVVDPPSEPENRTR